MAKIKQTIKSTVLLFFSVYLGTAMGFASANALNGSGQVAQALDFTQLFQDASPAVVNISTLSRPKVLPAWYGAEANQIPEIFRRYFGIPYPDDPAYGGLQQMSLGSGFIISKDGFILTNYHVVDGADQIVVKLNDRSEEPARIIGSDRRSDLVLLKVDVERDLPVVKLGNSASIKPGQWVAAIGSPFNFEYSITKGIISAINRSLPSDSYVPFIQTDVPINPGNSGGPLFDMSGEVIGVNSQIFTQSGGFMGLSFAIPIDHVMWVVDQLKDKGFVSWGWLGVAIQDIDRELAESFGLEKTGGALVTQIIAGGPSDKAKLQRGDVITRFNQHPIHNARALPMRVGTVSIGDSVEVEFFRDGKLYKSLIEVGELPNKNERSGRYSGQGTKENRLGVRVEKLSDQQKAELNLDSSVAGLLVTKVSPGPVRSLGLREGDVITDINQEQVSTVEMFEAAIQKLPVNRSIAMRIIRKGQPGYISFRLAD